MAPLGAFISLCSLYLFDMNVYSNAPTELTDWNTISLDSTGTYRSTIWDGDPDYEPYVYQCVLGPHLSVKALLEQTLLNDECPF